jgi:antitoxin component YwqK of YwqJK toxin-antitoxin module
MKSILQRQVIFFLQDLIKDRQMRLINILFLFPLIFGSCCNAITENKVAEKKIIKNTFVDNKQLVLIPEKGRWFFKGKSFNGFATMHHPNRKIAKKIGYFNGRKEGEALQYFKDGKLQKKSYYNQNKLDKKQLIFWGNGNLASEFNYENGTKKGVQNYWFENGQLAKRKNLKEGKENGLQQAWLQNGKIYVNYEAKNGRIFGLQRANLCYQLKDEKIEENRK